MDVGYFLIIVMLLAIFIVMIFGLSEIYTTLLDIKKLLVETKGLIEKNG